MFELVGFALQATKTVLFWSVHLAIGLYFLAILPEAALRLVNTILAFKAHLLKRAIDAELFNNGITSDLFWEKLRELEEFRVAIGGEVATVSFDPDHTVIVALGSGHIDCIPNRMLLMGDAPTPEEKENTEPLVIESEAAQDVTSDEPAAPIEDGSSCEIEAVADPVSEIESIGEPITEPTVESSEHPAFQPEEVAHALAN